MFTKQFSNIYIGSLVKNIIFVFMAIVLMFVFASSIFAQTFFAPTVLPPNGNITSPFNSNGVAQTKIAGLILNSGNVSTYGLLIPFGKVGIGSLTPNGLFEVLSGASSLFTVLANGNVGIGVANPVSRLSISGGIKVGDDTSTCTSANAGTLRWHSSVTEVCDGTVWVSL